MIELLTLIAFCAGGYDRFGGWEKVKGEATGFFHVEEIDGRWWLIDPEGNGFISKGVNHVSFTADYCPALGYSPYGRVTKEKYGDARSWAKAAVERLRSWNFNTIGAWSSPETFEQGMPYTVILNMAAKAGASWTKGTFPDVFSEEFAEKIDEIAREECAPRADDPYLIGYFTDNELRWGPDWRSPKTLLEDYLSFDPDAPGKRKLVEFLKRRYGSVEELNEVWGLKLESFDDLYELREVERNEAILMDSLDFLKLIAERYFEVCDEAIRRYDPNHLILGCRFAGGAPDPVLEAMAGHVDVVSINNYDFHPPVNILMNIFETTGLPVMITEFSFKAMDSGLPNTKGAGRPVQTQEERADCFERYVTELMKLPFVVGYHWFEYVDEPAEGRFDGENSNYGLVRINDEPWEILTERMREVNGRIEEIHLRGDGR